MSIAELSEQEQIRRNSLAQLRELGIDPYPAARYEVTATAAQIAAEYSPEKQNFSDISIAGRILSRRIMGSASFFELQDHTGKIQVYIKRDEVCGDDPEATLYNKVFKKLLDIGDIVGVRGFAFVTKTGELSVHCKELKLLSKSLRPLPIVKEKDGKVYDAFSDPELRYRQRYVDLIVNPQVRQVFLQRTKIIDTMRRFFNERGYVEVETPILQSIPGGASARPFVTHHNALDIPLYLRIANELYLKKLIVGGFDGVYEFGKDFRNEGMDRTHNPEFTVMEIYVAYKDYIWMMEFVEQMLKRVALALHGTTKVRIGEHTVDFAGPFRRVTMTDAIREKTGFDITGKSEQELREACAKLNVETDETMGKGKLIDAIFGAYCEQDLIQPTFVTDYPIEMSQQSRPDRAVRAVRNRQGAVQRLFRAERPDRPAGALSGTAAPERERRRRGDVHRHGLRPRAGVRHADLLGHGHRHRPAHDVHDGPDDDSGRAVLPADASRKGRPEGRSREIRRRRHSRAMGPRAA